MSNEWYTPARYIEAAREVMGGIDLDPASCEVANRVVKATRYYSQDENGLMKSWQAETLWLNPPYGKTAFGGVSYLEQFTRRLLQEYENGNVTQAILLIPVNTATRWFSLLWCHPVCFPSRRIRFNKTDNTPSDGAAFGTCFVYFGKNEQKFIEVFSLFGHIVRTINPTKQSPIALDLWECEVEA